MIEIGQIEAIFRYPVKSMAGEQLEAAELGWHGIEGDRRLALRRIQDSGSFPFLTAGRLPDLLLFRPLRREEGTREDLPTHVRTPDGSELAVFGTELAAEIERRHGSPVQMMHLRSGIFDEAAVSLITSGTVGEISRVADRALDFRRFRPNIVIRLLRPAAFEEDKWVGGFLSFGESGDGACVGITMRDLRCSMVNLDPESAGSSPEVMKSVVRLNQNNAGVYSNVFRPGRISTGQAVRLQKISER
jgi:MOSC domain-containing protein